MDRRNSSGPSMTRSNSNQGRGKSRERIRKDSTTSNHSISHRQHPISSVAHTNNNALGAPMDFDSASALGTDLIYRLDDAKREREAGRSKDDDQQLGHPPLSRSTSINDTNGNDQEQDQDHESDRQEAEEEEEDEEEEDAHQAWLKSKPWWKRPSDLWLRPCAFILAMTGGMAMAPRAELYLQIVCEEILPREAVQIGFAGETTTFSPNFNSSFNPSSTLNHQTPTSLDSAVYSSELQEQLVYSTTPQDQRSIEKASNDYSLVFSNLVSPSILPSNLHFLIETDPALSPNTSTPHVPGQTPPSRAERCRKSSLVVSLSTALQLKLTLAMGILSVLSTGFWTSLSDRSGRTLILALSVVGLLVTDCVVIFVARGGQIFGIGSSLLIIGNAIEGLLGGFSTLIAAHQAYLADTTPTGSSRATLFTKFAGVMFLGFMVGPFLGGLLVNKTRDLTSAFWIAGLSHVLYLLFVVFLLPESLSPQKRTEARREHEELKKARKVIMRGREGDDEESIGHESSLSRNRSPRSSMSHVRRGIRKLLAHEIFTPLHPMAMLLPRKVQVEETNQYVAHGLGQWATESTSRSASVRGRRGESIPTEEEPLLSNVEGEDGDAPQDLENGKGHSSTKGKVSSQSHISVSYVPELHPVPPSPHPLYSSELPPQIPTKSRPRDWNLFFLSIGYAFDAACFGVLSAKTLYAQHKYDWGPSQIGAFLSLAAFSRVVALTLVLPIGVSYFHKPVKAEALDAAKDESLSSADFKQPQGGASQIRISDPTSTSASDPVEAVDDNSVDSAESEHLQSNAEKELSTLWTQRAHHVKMLHDSSFDLNLARFSLFWMFACYAAMSLGQGPVVFCVATALSSLGGGGGAAMASLALNLIRKDTDAGKLLGAWSILSGICGSVMGPILFSMTFVKTVDTLPESIFIVGLSFFFTSFALLLLVKVRPAKSLPALPPPLSKTTEEMAAALKTPSKSSKNLKDIGTGRSTCSGPESSTKSKLRLKRTSAREVFDFPTPSRTRKTNTTDTLVDTSS